MEKALELIAALHDDKCDMSGFMAVIANEALLEKQNSPV